MKPYINLTTENKINNKESLFNTKLLYENDNRRIKYKHIIYYLNFGDSEEIGKYSEYIYDIYPKNRRKNAKKQFLKSCKGYYIDNKTNRLMKTIIYKNYKKESIEKHFYIAYINEKIQILKNLHENNMHRGVTSLYNLILR